MRVLLIGGCRGDYRRPSDGDQVSTPAHLQLNSASCTKRTAKIERVRAPVVSQQG